MGRWMMCSGKGRIGFGFPNRCVLSPAEHSVSDFDVIGLTNHSFPVQGLKLALNQLNSPDNFLNLILFTRIQIHFIFSRLVSPVSTVNGGGAIKKFLVLYHDTCNRRNRPCWIPLIV